MTYTTINFNDLTDNVNELAKVLTDNIYKLDIETFKEYYKSIYGEDNFYQENNLEDMLEVMTDPYTLWNSDADGLKTAINDVLNLLGR